ncbi:MAG: phosphoribosylformylglycinamidine synthase subunit PurQ [Desulfobacterales bacterium]|nr:MAG: phosphoribosylformylglycinamidine synthase subunit PurQ [Desulfobacterales bacterium]
MKAVRVLVLGGYGLNCDHETAYAFELAGASPCRVHINSLINGSVRLDAFQILVLIGGFSWGDDHGAGVIQAVRLKTQIGDKILEFVDQGNLVLGICNGFQTLANLGLLPGLDGDYEKRSVALTFNDCGNFRDQWVNLKTDTASPCIFTRGIDQLELPVRHGEGKLYGAKPTIERLLDTHQAALRYVLPNGEPARNRFPFNPNGSVHDIAGICDPTGRIFGLMPHPEAYNHWTNHPDWTRNREAAKRQGKPPPDADITPGLRMLQNAVNFIRESE